MRTAIFTLAALFGWQAAGLAAPVVKSEHLDPATPAWAFKTLPGPSRSDVAQGAAVVVVGNTLEKAGGPAAALVNGLMPENSLDLGEEVFFTNANAIGGSFAIDLGKVQPVAAVNSYSWHEYNVDQGARAPQVYTLYGSAAEKPDPTTPATWTKIADVDTRPNTNGEKWGGQYGVSVSDPAGPLGQFRHLLFVIQPTRSPKQPDARVTDTLFAEIDVHTADTLAKAGDASTWKSPVEEIIVVCKTHFDIGYTHRVKDLLSYYRTTMIDRAMNTMEASKNLPPEQQFVWTAPGWVMARVLDDWPGQTPERRQKLDSLFKSGRFVVHAVPFTLESDAACPEDLARGFQPSSEVVRRYGLPLPRDAKMTDVPSHGRALATALANGGVQFMHIGCNWPSGYVKTPPLFWWEGPDGSRVLTIYSVNYSTCTAFNPWGGVHEPNFGRNFLPPKDWPYKVWPAIVVTPDNSGPPNPNAIKPLFDEVARKMPGVKIRMGRMEDFADAILKSGVELPVVKAEMPDTWIHGIMCDPGGMKTARRLQVEMPEAEALNTQLRFWGLPLADPAKEISKAYEQSLLYSEHTWGGAAAVNQYGAAFQKLPPDRYKDLEGSWEDKTDYIRTAAKIVDPLLQSNLAALAQNVKADGPRVVIYNPLPWTRSGIVDVAGQPLQVQDIPPCGYKTLRLSTPAASASPSTATILENELFKIAFDPAKGTIASLVDKRTGRDWVDTGATDGFGQYLNERFTYEQTLRYTMEYQQGRAGGWPHPGMHKPGMISEKQVPYRAASPAHGTLQIQRNGLEQTAILDLPANPGHHLPGASLRVTLQAGQPQVDLEITLKDKAKDNWPEADWLCLPFKIQAPKFTVGRQLGTMDPTTGIMPGANRDLYSVGAGVAISDGSGSGIVVCPLDHPLVSLDRPGCWKFTPDFVPKRPIVYLNLYNNQWNTNFRYWYPGTWSSRVRLWTFGPQEKAATALAIPALEARLPLRSATADGPGGSLPPEQAGLAVSRPGVQVTAFGTDFDDPQKTLLRLWEMAGNSGEMTVTLPAGKAFTSATPVNLRGEKLGAPLKVTGNAFSFVLNAYAPASFVLE